MLKKNYYFLLILFILAQSCKDSSNEVQTEFSHDQVLADTKAWFNELNELSETNSMSGVRTAFPKNKRDLAEPKVDWKHPEIFRRGNDKFVVSAPVLNRSRTGRSAYQLIVFREKNKTVSGFIVEVIPDRAYIKKEKQKNDRSFSGQVKLLTATGKRIKTQKFVDGTEVDFYSSASSTQRTAWGEDGEPIILDEVVIVGESWDDNTYYTWIEDPGWSYDDDNWDDWGGWNDSWVHDDFNGDGNIDIGIPTSVNSIINQVQDPCMSAQVENALDLGFTNAISDVMECIYGNSTDYDLIIKQGDVSGNDWAATTARGGEVPANGSFWLEVTITLNDNKLPYASQEFIMATIYHELLHASMTYEGIPTNATQQQHNEMAQNYINVLTNALMSQFPGLTRADAERLSWGGLESTTAWNNLGSALKSAILSTNSQHGSGNAGMPCN